MKTRKRIISGRHPNSNRYHFFLRAEEGMTLQSLIVLALDDVGKHFVVHLVRCAI